MKVELSPEDSLILREILAPVFDAKRLDSLGKAMIVLQGPANAYLVGEEKRGLDFQELSQEKPFPPLRGSVEQHPVDPFRTSHGTLQPSPQSIVMGVLANPVLRHMIWRRGVWLYEEEIESVYIYKESMRQKIKEGVWGSTDFLELSSPSKE